MLLAHPLGHIAHADRKGLPAIFDVLQGPLGGWSGRQLVSLTPQQVVLCGIAASEPSFMPPPLTKAAGCLAAQPVSLGGLALLRAFGRLDTFDMANSTRRSPKVSRQVGYAAISSLR